MGYRDIIKARGSICLGSVEVRIIVKTAGVISQMLHGTGIFTFISSKKLAICR